MVDKDVNTFEGNRPLDFTSNESLCEMLDHLLRVTTLGTLDQKMEYTRLFTQHISYVSPPD